MFWGVLRLASALLIIAGFLVAILACICAVMYLIVIATSYLPLVGKRRRHDRWTEMNAVSNAIKRSVPPDRSH